MNGIQKYKCAFCHHQFRLQKRPKIELVWQDYVALNMTLSQLAIKYQYSTKTIQRWLKKYAIHTPKKVDKNIILLIDTTFWGRELALTVFKDEITGENLLWYFSIKEDKSLYLKGISALEKQGFTILAVVTDGIGYSLRKEINYPLQLCLIHQIRSVHACIPRKAKSPAGKALRALSSQIYHLNQAQFSQQLEAWFVEFEDFYKERTVNPETGKWQDTHRPLRRAYHSLKRHYPYLFTYQSYSSLSIPKTTNKIEGFFSKLKQKLRCHNGLSFEQKKKIIESILIEN